MAGGVARALVDSLRRTLSAGMGSVTRGSVVRHTADTLGLEPRAGAA